MSLETASRLLSAEKEWSAMGAWNRRWASGWGDIVTALGGEDWGWMEMEGIGAALDYHDGWI